MKSPVARKRPERKAAPRKSKATGMAVLLTEPQPVAATDEEDDSWIFDRHDLRYRQPLLPAGEDFKAHLLALGEVRLDWPRDWNRTPSK